MKVFSLKKYMANMFYTREEVRGSWAEECDGQPSDGEKVIGKDGCTYLSDDDWCEEVKEKGATKLTKLNRIKSVVARVLEAHEEARKDDFVLFALVCDEMGVPSNFDLRTMLHEHKLFGLPSWESVSRARRKIQAEYRALTDAKTVEKRAEEIPVYKEFARQ